MGKVNSKTQERIEVRKEIEESTATTSQGHIRQQREEQASKVQSPKKLSVRSSFSVFLADFKASNNK